MALPSPVGVLSVSIAVLAVHSGGAVVSPHGVLIVSMDDYAWVSGSARVFPSPIGVL